VELKNKIYGNVNIRKGSTIGYLKQVYEKEQEDIVVEDYLKQSFKEYTLIENRLREMELQMANDDQNLELILQKYGKLQEKYIALGGFELEEKFKTIDGIVSCKVYEINDNGSKLALDATCDFEKIVKLGVDDANAYFEGKIWEVNKTLPSFERISKINIIKG
jgi:ATPase subunit of ABC transporter with duplicated ATPase domains